LAVRGKSFWKVATALTTAAVNVRNAPRTPVSAMIAHVTTKPRNSGRTPGAYRAWRITKITEGRLSRITEISHGLAVVEAL
jgi:hypothetical protein